MRRIISVGLWVILTISIILNILLSLYCFRCRVINASDNALFDKYSLDPLINLTSDLTSSKPCETFQQMYEMQRKAMFKLYGDPTEDAAKYGIRTLHVGGRRIRVFPSEQPVGICIFIHGGGWTIGGCDEQDKYLVDLARRTNQTVCSLDYRLVVQSAANKYPAGPDDCELLSAYIIDNPSKVEPLLPQIPVFTICGNSAGAQLALVVMLRLRNRYGSCPFSRASFFYGGFVPQETSPQCSEPYAARGKTVGPAYTPGKDYKFLTIQLYQRFQRAYSTDYLNPEVNLSLANMKGLCPAQFVVGTEDLLLRCNVDAYHQWRFFENSGELQVFEGQPHGFASLPTPSGRRAATLRAMYLKSASF